MAYLQLTDLESIKNLTVGEFALPVFDSSACLDFRDTLELRRTIKRMRTILKKKVFPAASNLIPNIDDNCLPGHMKKLEAAIITRIRDYLKNRDTDLLVNVFHIIHLWGGNAGRNIYVMNGGFWKNFGIDRYEGFVDAVLGNDSSSDAEIRAIEQAAKEINQFGAAFATKHGRFWSEGADKDRRALLPIYDKIMARGTLGYKAAEWKRYHRFVHEMHDHADEVGTNVLNLERFAFISFGSDDGKKWWQARV